MIALTPETSLPPSVVSLTTHLGKTVGWATSVRTYRRSSDGSEFRVKLLTNSSLVRKSSGRVDAYFTPHPAVGEKKLTCGTAGRWSLLAPMSVSRRAVWFVPCSTSIAVVLGLGTRTRTSTGGPGLTLDRRPQRAHGMPRAGVRAEALRGPRSRTQAQSPTTPLCSQTHR